MKISIKALLAVILLFSATGSFAFWNNGWGNNYNPYDEWDPRYWAEEFFGGNGNNGPWNNGSRNNGPWNNNGPWTNGYGAPWNNGGPAYGRGPYNGGPGYGPAPYNGNVWPR